MSVYCLAGWAGTHLGSMVASWGPFGTSGNWRHSLETENKVFVRAGREGRLGVSWDIVSRIKGNLKYSLLLD